MIFRIQHVDGEYRILVPIEAMEAMNLKPGAPVDLVPATEPIQAAHRDMTVDEMLDAYQRTEHLHRNTYRELAKGPKPPPDDALN